VGCCAAGPDPQKKGRTSHFFRETRAVLPRTVFSEMPCLKLSVDSYK